VLKSKMTLDGDTVSITLEPSNKIEEEMLGAFYNESGMAQVSVSQSYRSTVGKSKSVGLPSIEFSTSMMKTIKNITVTGNIEDPIVSEKAPVLCKEGKVVNGD